jgi:hypothetical protein
MDTMRHARAMAWSAVALTAVLMCGTLASAATLDQKVNAIEMGLDYLARNQQADGRWRFNGNAAWDCAATAAALTAFQKAGYRAGEDVTIGGTHYGDVVGNGFGYVFSQGQELNIGARPFGNPDTDGDGKGVRFGAGYDVQVGGNVLRAIVASDSPSAVVSTGPLAGRTYENVVRDAIDYYGFAQVANCGYHDGGWRYTCNYTSSCQSCTPWAAHAMLAAGQWGIEPPAWVTGKLDQYVGLLQSPSDGGAYYQPNGNMGTNVYRTGEMLTEQHLLGYNAGDTNVAMALGFINARWQQPPGSWQGHFGEPGAMWATFQGLAYTIGLDDTGTITNLRTYDPATMDLDPDATWNWSEDACEWLVDNQRADGSWPNYGVWYGTMPTSFATESLIMSAPEPGCAVLLLCGAAALLRRRKRS